MTQPASPRPGFLLPAAAVLAASALITGMIALAHIGLTALRGPICGLQDGHCWACYAAPLLATAAATAWRAHLGALTPARVRVRERLRNRP